MAKWLDPDSFLYRKRYIIGYAIITLAFLAILYLAGTLVPGGLNKTEEQSLVTAAGLDLQNPESFAVSNLPYYALQRGIVELFGVSVITIKLPSLILAFVAGIGAVFLLRRWFKPNIALLSTMIIITTGQFLYVAQSGTPSIMFIVWPIWLLLTATLITTAPTYARFWKILFFILVPLSLYTPLSIYIVLAIVSAGLIHPHVRYVLRRMSKLHLVLLCLLSFALVAPLAYLATREPSLIGQLFGLPEAWPPNLAENGRTLLQQYFNFIQPQSGALMTPVLGLGSILLIALGIWRLFKIRYTARSYTIVAWVILLIPVLLINPTFTTVAFVPLLILLAMGLEFLLRSWYRMFPRNPYARFVGLVPLAILVSGLMISGMSRYFHGYRHDPTTASQFTDDLTILQSKIVSDKQTLLIAHKDEAPFYEAVAAINGDKRGKLVVVTTPPSSVSKQFGTIAATHSAHTDVDLPIERIVTTHTSNDANRFYTYKTK